MDQKKREYRVREAKPISAEMTVPGDKSVSHRSIMIAALSNGRCEIDGFLPSADCLATMGAMRALGIKIEVLEENSAGPTRIAVHGNSLELTEPSAPIDCGNSGTSMRLIAGILAAQPFRSQLTGDPSLSRRPMGRIIDPLSAMGADITAEGEKGCPPLNIRGCELKPVHYELPVASAQVKSAILLAGLFTRGKTTITQPQTTRDHTERMFKQFQVKTLVDGNDISIYGRQTPESQDFTVPGDISSAAFWLVAASVQPGARLTIQNVGLNPTRAGIIDILVRMGANITDTVIDAEAGEPTGHVTVRGGSLKGIEIGGDIIPNIIDELPVIAVAAALAQGTTIIRDAGELRVKETDRIFAVAENLRRMGVEVDEQYDGMTIHGTDTLTGARIDSFGDHRIAMAFAIAGLFAEGETVIENVDCVDTSYPGFELELKRFMSSKISEGERTPTISSVTKRSQPEGAPRTHLEQAPLVVAIDGPAASGKSSVARALAAAHGLTYINSGAMYRAVTWSALQAGVDPSDEAAVIAHLDASPIDYTTIGGVAQFTIGGCDAGDELKSAEVNDQVSTIASHGGVRERLVAQQREIGKNGRIVMEGRDIGSVVFPDTPHKFYIDASEEVRRGRRQSEGFNDDLSKRDQLDSSRENSPLVVDPGATTIDSSELTIDQVVEAIAGHLGGALG